MFNQPPPPPPKAPWIKRSLFIMDSIKEEKIHDVDSSVLISILDICVALSAYPIHMYELVNVFINFNYLHATIGSIFTFYYET